MNAENARLRLTGTRRRRLTGDANSWATYSQLSPTLPAPVVVTPTTDGVHLGAWAKRNREQIHELFEQRLAVLFRGFVPGAVDEFEDFVETCSNGPLLSYRDRSTPRETRGNKSYTSTVYPADQRIALHNEGTYWIEWPLKLFFSCRDVPAEGGATPIADVGGVYSRIPLSIRESFEQRGMALVRNFNQGFGLPWEEVFQTKDRDEVERYCSDNQIEWEWRGCNGLRTRQQRPAVRLHPRTGRKLWFNHGAFFNVASLDERLRRTMLSDFGEEGLPYNTYFGDGAPIPEDVISAIRAAYEAETMRFDWQRGDVLILDNMSMAHGREPFIGSREVIVAMSEPYREDLTSPGSHPANASV